MQKPYPTLPSTHLRKASLKHSDLGFQAIQAP